MGHVVFYSGERVDGREFTGAFDRMLSDGVAVLKIQPPIPGPYYRRIDDIVEVAIGRNNVGTSIGSDPSRWPLTGRLFLPTDGQRLEDGDLVYQDRVEMRWSDTALPATGDE